MARRVIAGPQWLPVTDRVIPSDVKAAGFELNNGENSILLPTRINLMELGAQLGLEFCVCLDFLVGFLLFVPLPSQ